VDTLKQAESSVQAASGIVSNGGECSSASSSHLQ
jgi:hypothetical protein